MAAGTLGVYVWARSAVEADVATTLAFTTFVLFQSVNAFNARSETATALRRHSLANRRLLAALAVVVVLQVLVVHVPFAQPVFDTTALTPTQWGLCAAVAVSVLLVEETRKAISRALRRRAA
jgi:Ca2+-transporting ATPase